MKAITLRNIPMEISVKIQQQAASSGSSLNKAVIDLLTQTIGPPVVKPHRYHDLDWFIGSWTREEADEFDAALAEMRVIDPELWK